MIKELNNITSVPDMFVASELSYYSWSPVCVQDLFGIQESLLFYKIGYMVCLGAILLAIAVSYFKILYHFLKSQSEVVAPKSAERKVAGNAAGEVTRDIATAGNSIEGAVRNPAEIVKKDLTTQTKVKVTLIVGTKLVSWLLIVAAIIYYAVKKDHAPIGWYEFTAFFLIPVNSFLNPIFNSDIFSRLVEKR